MLLASDAGIFDAWCRHQGRRRSNRARFTTESGMDVLRPAVRDFAGTLVTAGPPIR